MREFKTCFICIDGPRPLISNPKCIQEIVVNLTFDGKCAVGGSESEINTDASLEDLWEDRAKVLASELKKRLANAS